MIYSDLDPALLIIPHLDPESELSRKLGQEKNLQIVIRFCA